MRTSLLILLVFFFTTGCKKKNRIPDGVLSQKKMQVILWDMMRADQFLSVYVLNKDSTLSKTTESLKYYQQIFAIHKISKEEFQHSFSFYRSHPALLKEIMDSISTPGNDAPTSPIQPEQVTAPVIVQPDPNTKDPGKTVRDTTSLRIREKPLLPD